MLEYNPTKIQWILYIHNYSNYDMIILYDKKIYSENVTEYLCRYFAWNKNFANRQNYYYALFIITQLTCANLKPKCWFFLPWEGWNDCKPRKTISNQQQHELFLLGKLFPKWQPILGHCSLQIFLMFWVERQVL